MSIDVRENWDRKRRRSRRWKYNYCTWHKFFQVTFWRDTSIDRLTRFSLHIHTVLFIPTSLSVTIKRSKKKFSPRLNISNEQSSDFSGEGGGAAELPVIPGSVCVCIWCFICECQMSRQFPFLTGEGQKGEIQLEWRRKSITTCTEK
jgi:hypothetical protein